MFSEKQIFCLVLLFCISYVSTRVQAVFRVLPQFIPEQGGTGKRLQHQALHALFWLLHIMHLGLGLISAMVSGKTLCDLFRTNQNYSLCCVFLLVPLSQCKTTFKTYPKPGLVPALFSFNNATKIAVSFLVYVKEKTNHKMMLTIQTLDCLADKLWRIQEKNISVNPEVFLFSESGEIK